MKVIAGVLTVRRYRSTRTAINPETELHRSNKNSSKWWDFCSSWPRRRHATIVAESSWIWHGGHCIFGGWNVVTEDRGTEEEKLWPSLRFMARSSTIVRGGLEVSQKTPVLSVNQKWGWSSRGSTPHNPAKPCARCRASYRTASAERDLTLSQRDGNVNIHGVPSQSIRRATRG